MALQVSLYGLAAKRELELTRIDAFMRMWNDCWKEGYQMPLYEYRCSGCDHHFEVLHEVGGTPGPCPVCGGPARRVFSSVGLIFKGSGFYTTDHRKPSSSNGGETKSTADTKTTPSPSRPDSSSPKS